MKNFFTFLLGFIPFLSSNAIDVGYCYNQLEFNKVKHSHNSIVLSLNAMNGVNIDLSNKTYLSQKESLPYFRNILRAQYRIVTKYGSLYPVFEQDYLVYKLLDMSNYEEDPEWSDPEFDQSINISRMSGKCGAKLEREFGKIQSSLVILHVQNIFYHSLQGNNFYFVGEHFRKTSGLQVQCEGIYRFDERSRVQISCSLENSYNNRFRAISLESSVGFVF